MNRNLEEEADRLMAEAITDPKRAAAELIARIAALTYALDKLRLCPQEFFPAMHAAYHECLGESEFADEKFDVLWGCIMNATVCQTLAEYCMKVRTLQREYVSRKDTPGKVH
jgi:hypothetical protein